MGSEKTAMEIVDTAYRTEALARDLYSLFAEYSESPDIKDFWTELSADEGDHLDFWFNLREMSKSLPFGISLQDPESLLSLMTSARDAATAMLDEASGRDPGSISVSEMLLAAYRLELYMLDSTFQTLFQSLRFLQKDFDPVKEYDRHIERFIQGLRKFGSGDSGTELLAETISRLWRENKRLTSLALEDVLTGVLNRRGFMTMALQVCALLRRKRSGAGVIMIDLDRFKDLNDSRGHMTGDRALVLTARVLRSSLRESDLIGRYGGDEFVVMLPETRDTEKVCRKLLSALNESLSESFGITASAGCISADVDCEDLQNCLGDMIRKADYKLYQSKREAGVFRRASQGE